MKLLGNDRSPYVRKVRLVLEEKRIPHDYVLAAPSDPAAGVAEINPLGKIPALVRDDGRPLYDSPVIVEYLDSLGTGPKLIPEAFADRIEVKRWEALGDGIADATVAISHDFRVPPAQRQSPEWHAKQQRKIDAGLAVMERDLGTRAFCHGNGFTLADIACGMALGYLTQALPKVEWRRKHPALARHAERLEAREAFRKTAAVPA